MGDDGSAGSSGTWGLQTWKRSHYRFLEACCFTKNVLLDQGLKPEMPVPHNNTAISSAGSCHVLRRLPEEGVTGFISPRTLELMWGSLLPLPSGLGWAGCWPFSGVPASTHFYPPSDFLLPNSKDPVSFILCLWIRWEGVGSVHLGIFDVNYRPNSCNMDLQSHTWHSKAITIILSEFLPCLFFPEEVKVEYPLLDFTNCETSITSDTAWL